MKTSIVVCEDKEKTERRSLMLLDTVKSIEIYNKPDYESASRFLKDVKGEIKATDEQRKEKARPYKDEIKKIDNLYKAPLVMLKSAKFILIDKLNAYDELVEAERIKEQAQLDKERKALEDRADKWKEKQTETGDRKASELLGQAMSVQDKATVSHVKVEGSHSYDRWMCEVVDEKLVPREYMMPDMKALNKIAIATKGKVGIAGVRFFSKKVRVDR